MSKFSATAVVRDTWRALAAGSCAGVPLTLANGVCMLSDLLLRSRQFSTILVRSHAGVLQMCPRTGGCA